MDITGFKKNGSDIDLQFDKIDKNKLTAFIIRVSGIELQDNARAFQKAHRFTILLTLKTGRFVFHSVQGNLPMVIYAKC